ncbi:hypothetical protein JZ751_015620 [Albula glossodonta]|uniref:Zinc finger-containing ubiquitin peptidase 1 n=1 Tax=Albula glossodonta TaxID=121402 RepID=A0A8T2P262_9TELE|nr:hypothetical protein JZ751_015620 [Albula glossodonta]
MLTCEICGEDVPSPGEMRSHLRVSHLEALVKCPLCPLEGVSYDELHFHIHTAHAEEGADSPKKPAKTLAFPVRARPADIPENTSQRGLPGCHGAANRDSSDRGAVGGVSHASSNECSSVRVTNGSRTLEHKLSPKAGSMSPQKLTRTDGQACLPQGENLNSTQSSAEKSSRVEQEPVKTKQKRLSSPRKEKLHPCPMCSLLFTDCFILQEHVELHLQESGGAEGSRDQRYECPLCSLSFADSGSLQIHVELHLETGTPSGSGSTHSDLQLARKLQEEEEEKRKAEEARREAEEFKKLQKQFGLDASGGYRRQLERNLEREVSRGNMAPAEFHRKRAEIMESLASGVDDGRTRTSGVIGSLCQYYQREGNDVVHIWLSAETDHYSSGEGDRGWGCGYRNFQMLLSSLHKMEAYRGCGTNGAIPSLPRVQALMEKAWREGLDPQGASHFSHKLQGTRAWIGATEIYSLFTSLGVRARIMDFHQPTGPGNTHPRLFEWVKQYFAMSDSRGARLPPRVVQTTLPPIYLQHQGHSRTIVGVEQRKNGSLCLLIFDPGCSPGDMRKLLGRDITGSNVRHLRKFTGSLKHKQYQIVTVEGVLSPEEKQVRIANSRTLRAERVP